MADTRVLASGRMAFVDDDGRAELVTCSWLVRVASGNPEPDSIEDTYRDVECGEPMRFDAPDGMVCDAGHEFGNMARRLGPGGTEWQREELERLDEARGVYA